MISETHAREPEDQSTGSVLKLQGAVLGYAGVSVIQVDALEVRENEVVAIVGRSGCGKTTLLAAIAGALEPHAGQLEIRGSSRSGRWRAQHTSRTLQNFPLLHWLTVRGNLKLAAKIRGVRLDASGCDAILSDFAAGPLADRYPSTLSGGERCRASLAQAVVASPALLLLDEPFTGLDSLVKEEIAETLFGFARTRSVGVLLVTHDLTDASAFADRVIVLAGDPISIIVGEVIGRQPNALQDVRRLLRLGGLPSQTHVKLADLA